MVTENNRIWVYINFTDHKKVTILNVQSTIMIEHIRRYSLADVLISVGRGNEDSHMHKNRFTNKTGLLELDPKDKTMLLLGGVTPNLKKQLQCP